MTSFEKLNISLRYWLLGASQSQPEYLLALDAMEFARGFHCGKRKDGLTPEFQHQLEIAQYLRTMQRSLLFPAQTLAVAFLHDVAEDYDIGFEELERRFGKQIAHSVQLLTKKHRGQHVPMSVYFERIAQDPIASAVKGADRVNNLQSMLGVFTLAKQLSYCQEVRDHFLPMLKTARRMFAAQEPAYENIKLMLRSQLALLSAAHAGPDCAAVCRPSLVASGTVVQDPQVAQGAA